MRTPDGLVPWVDLDPARREPLYRQLYRGLREAVLSGRLEPGARIPSTRTLADELDVSRTTVIEAYRQLRAEGYIESRVGAGTRITPTLPEERLRAPAALPAPGALNGATADNPAGRSNGRTAPRHAHASQSGPSGPGLSRRGTIAAELGWRAIHKEPAEPFLPGIPALDEFPLRAWESARRRAARLDAVSRLDRPDSAGRRELREAVAKHVRLSRGLRCGVEQIVITTGAQQALARLAELLLDPGDEAIIEEPGYVGARRALAGAGARLTPVRVDGDGLDVEAAIERAPDARAAYVTPSHQFPMGVTMSLERRLRLLDWAEQAGAWVLEDDFDSEYRFEGRPLQALQGLDRAGRVIYIGTFSKMLFPGLRLGYVVLPPGLVEPFTAVRAGADAPPPTMDQLTVTEFMVRGHFGRHVRRMRTLYRERRDTLIDAIREGWPAPIEIGPAEAGMHVTVRLPPELDDRAISERARQTGLVAAPLSASALEPLDRGGLVLGFAGWPPDRLRTAAVRLAELLVRN